jgi:hypothetical protein
VQAPLARSGDAREAPPLPGSGGESAPLASTGSGASGGLVGADAGTRPVTAPAGSLAALGGAASGFSGMGGGTSELSVCLLVLWLCSQIINAHTGSMVVRLVLSTWPAILCDHFPCAAKVLVSSRCATRHCSMHSCTTTGR